MSVFLRWGIFGILGVAALLYAYNASKRMAENHARQTPAAASGASSAAPPAAAPPPPAPVAVQPVAVRTPDPPHCEKELVVAKRAIEARKNGEPLDRLLRIQEIAFEDWAPRRARLQQVASRYYNYEGDFVPEALRIAVISDCVMHAPLPIPAP